MSVTVPAPALVKPPAPLMTPVIVSVVPALLTVTVRVAANVVARLTVFVPAILLSARPPAPSVMALPPRVYPLPQIVMELNLELLMLLLVERFEAPLGNTRFSPPFPVGAAPPNQLALVFQFGFLAPVQVNVCAAPRGARDRKSTRLNSSHSQISYAVFCLKKKKKQTQANTDTIHIQT